MSKHGLDIESKPSKKDIGDGFYYSLYEEQVNLATQETYQHLIYEIVSETGVQQASEINISYVPQYQRLIFHHITIHRNGQKINALDLKRIKKLQTEPDLSMFIYNGNYRAYIILDDIRKGDRIEYDYTITGFNPVFNKYCQLFNIACDGTTITNYYIGIKVPGNRRLHIKPFNGAPNARISQGGGFTAYEWVVKNLKPYEYEEDEPSWYRGYPQIEITEYASWTEVINWAVPLMDYNNIVTPDVKRKAAELMKRQMEIRRFISKRLRVLCRMKYAIWAWK